MLYPLKMIPYFRHGEETPWGGRALGDYFGKDIPDDRTGESLRQFLARFCRLVQPFLRQFREVCL